MAPGSDQCDVVTLLIRTELSDIVENRCDQRVGGEGTITAGGLNEPLFSVFFSFGIDRFRYTIGVQNQDVSQKQSRLPY